jgi:hypothetical protein
VRVRTPRGVFRLLVPGVPPPNRRAERHTVEEIQFARRDIGPSRVVCSCGAIRYGHHEEIRRAFDRHRQDVRSNKEHLQALATNRTDG